MSQRPGPGCPSAQMTAAGRCHEVTHCKLVGGDAVEWTASIRASSFILSCDLPQEGRAFPVSPLLLFLYFLLFVLCMSQNTHTLTALCGTEGTNRGFFFLLEKVSLQQYCHNSVSFEQIVLILGAFNSPCKSAGTHLFRSPK
jgi:hypothetical protein